MTWFRISAPHFVAAVAFDDAGRMTKHAPILAWARRQSLAWVQDYCRRKGWTMERLP